MNLSQLNLHGKRALIADDEQDIRGVIRIVLECLGVDVTEAGDGEEALTIYSREPFNLVLTDYAMPKMRGDALARAIKNINPKQRVVMVSGFAEQVLENGRLPAFIDVLVPKPCSMDQLTDALA